MKELGTIIKDTLDNIADGILFFDANYKVVFANKTALQLFGLEGHDIVGRGCHELFRASPNSYSKPPPSFNCYCADVFETGKPAYKTYSHILPDGTEKVFDITASPIRNEKGDVIQVVEILRDVTQEKKTDEGLHKSMERYRALFEQAADSIVLIDAETGALVEFNNKAFESLGYNRKEFQNLKIPDFEVIESEEDVSAHIKKIIKKGADVFETKHRKKDGEIRDILVSSRAISIGGRNFIQGIWRDITERKQAEGTLMESEERFRRLSEAAIEGVAITENAKFLDVSKTFAKMFGYKPSEIIGMDVLKVVAPEYHDLVMQKILSGYEKPYEAVGVRKNGELFPVEVCGKSIHYKGKKARVTALRDITERKQAEEEAKAAFFRMQEEKAKTQAILASMGDALGIVDTNYKIIYQNQVSKDMFGEHIGELCYRAYQQKEQVCEGCPVHEAFKDGEVHRTERTKSTGNEIKYYDITVSPLKDSTGKIIAGIEVVRDVTERKLMERDLSRYGEHLRVLREIDHAILTTESIEKIVRIALDRIMELIPVMRVSLALFDFDTDQATVFSARSKGETRLGTGVHFPIDEFGISDELLKGKIRVCEDISKVSNPPQVINKLRDEGLRSYINIPLFYLDELIGTLNMGRSTPGAFASEDVTIASEVADLLAVAIQQVRGQEELKVSEAKFRDLYDNAPDMYHSLDKNGIIVDCNKTWTRMLGYKKRETIGKHLTDFYTEGSKEFFKKDILKLTKKKVLLNVEREFVRKDGTVFPCILNVFAEFDENGALSSTRAIARDITERKKAEEAQRKKTEQVINYQTALLKLTKMDKTNLDTTLKMITETDSKALGVERVSVWLFNKDNSEIFCEDLYKLNRNLHERGIKIYAKDYPRYFEALKENRTIAADDARADLRTNEFTEGYLEPFGIISMMDVPVWLHGEVVGIVCHEHTGQSREWMPEEQEFVASIADIVALTLEASKRKQAEDTLRRSAQRLAIIHEIDKAVLTARPVEEMARVALKYIGQTMPCQWASVVLFDLKAGQVIVNAVYAPGKIVVEEGKLFSLEEFGFCEDFHFGEIKEVKDIKKLSELSHLDQLMMADGIRAYISVPLLYLDELLGSLNIGVDKPYAFSNEDIEVAREIADMLSVAIESKGAEKALKESEEKYRGLVDNALVGIYKSGLKGDILYVNKILSRMLEFESPEEMMQSNVLESYKNPEDRDVLIEKLRKGDKVENFEVKLLTKTGKIKDVFLSARLENGFISGMIMDITGQRQAEDAIKASERFLSSVLEGIKDGVVVLDRDFKILFVNRTYIEQTGIASNDVKGKYCYEVSYNRDEPCFLEGLECVVNDVFKTGMSSREIRKKSGRYIEMTVYPLKDLSGKIISVVEMRRDVTKHIKIDEELKKKMRELEEFYEMAVSRELRMKQLKEEMIELKEKSKEAKH